MSVSETGWKFPKTTEFIFSQAACRLKRLKLLLKLTDTEIAGEYDKKVINRIINGRRTRNNPYLIPHAYVQPLVDKLGLQSEYELFWGDSDDEQFIETIFCHLLTDILEEERDDSCADVVDKVLLDDVGYAKIQPTVMSAYEYVNENGEYLPISPINYVNDTEQVAFDERRRIRHNAILRLFRNTRPVEMFRNFFREANNDGDNRGFSKLDTRLANFVRKTLIPFLNANMPNENSLGMRVYSIVEADIRKHVELELVNHTRTGAGFDKYLGDEYEQVLRLLTLAGRDYISKIEKLQERLDATLRKEKFQP